MIAKKISILSVILALLLIPACGVFREGRFSLSEESISTELWSGPAISHHNAHGLIPVKSIGKGSINDIAWSPDGTYLTLATNTGIYLVDIQSHQEVHLSDIASNEIAFSHDGSLLASAEGTQVMLRDPDNGQAIDVFDNHTNQINSIAFSPTENTLASASRDGMIKLWDLASGEGHKTFGESGSVTFYVEFTPNGKTLVSSAWNEGVKVTLWDVASGRGTEMDFDHAVPPMDMEAELAISPQGETIYVGGLIGPVKLVGLDGRERLTLEGTPQWPFGQWTAEAAFSPDGKTLAASLIENPYTMGLKHSTLNVWDATSGEVLHTLDKAGKYHNIAFSPAGTQLAAATVKEVRIWDVETGTETAVITGGSNAKDAGGYGKNCITDLTWSPDGNSLALASCTGTYLVDPQTNEEIQLSADGEQPQHGHTIDFSPDGNLLAAAYEKGVIEIYNTRSQEMELSLDGFDISGGSFGIAFSPEDARLAIGQSVYHGPVKLWDVSAGEVGEVTDAFSQELWVSDNLTFNQDGTFLAAISGSDIWLGEAKVHIWNLEKGSGERILTGIEGGSCALAFSPDSKILAAGNTVFDLESGEELFTLAGYQDNINDLDFNADGSVLASADWDGGVRLWDVETGKLLAVLDVPGASNVAFNPDGTLLATAGYRDVLRFWGVPEKSAQELPFTAQPEGKPGDEPNLISPLFLGEGFSQGKWSPSGRYYYYSVREPGDESGSTPTFPTPHFLNTLTGETCTSTTEITASDTFLWKRTLWINDNRLLYLSPDGELFAITPCSRSSENWTASLPDSVTAFHHSIKHDRSQILLQGDGETWIFTPSTHQSVKVNIPSSNAEEANLFAWSPWEEKLVSSRIERREGWAGVVVENIDPVTGQAVLITEFPFEDFSEDDSSQFIANFHIAWVAKDQLLVDFMDKHHLHEKLIDLSSQPVKLTDVFQELIEIKHLNPWFLVPLSDNHSFAFGGISTMGEDDYYLIYSTGGLHYGRFYLYSAETDEMETYQLSPPKLLILPHGDVVVAKYVDDQYPLCGHSFQVIQTSTDLDPYSLEIKGHIPQECGGKLVKLPNRQQLMVASDQGISMVDLESGETIKFWALQGLEQFNDLSINLSPDGKHLIVHAADSPIYTGTGSYSATAIYWLRLDG